MIALPHHLPLIRNEDNHLTPCQFEWLEQKILDASDEADVPHFVSLSVAKGIYRYFSKSYEGTVIDSEELHDKICSLLKEIGLESVSEKLDRTPPPARINLADLARKAGSGGEMSFFSLLEGKCQDILNFGAHDLVLDGFNECIEELKRHRNSSSSHHDLRTAIESQINELRRVGEVCLPIFNVTVQ
ncbi:MAG: hypothetical protein P1V20_09405 [Verrucomicrobiales bacterium]|nr:hypothetical protein [Verrucomicrobiales bacterium]